MIGDDGSLCGRCMALWFSRVLTFALSGAPPRTQAKGTLLIGASVLERVVRTVSMFYCVQQHLVHSHL